MDASDLVTHSDTKKSIRDTHIFMIINSVIIVILIGAAVGWLFYAKSKDKWPFERYVRGGGPPGTIKVDPENLKKLQAKDDT